MVLTDIEVAAAVAKDVDAGPDVLAWRGKGGGGMVSYVVLANWLTLGRPTFGCRSVVLRPSSGETKSKV